MLLPVVCPFFQGNMPRNLFCKVILFLTQLIVRKHFCNDFGLNGHHFGSNSVQHFLTHGVGQTRMTKHVLSKTTMISELPVLLLGKQLLEASFVRRWEGVRLPQIFWNLPGVPRISPEVLWKIPRNFFHCEFESNPLSVPQGPKRPLFLQWNWPA